MWSLLRANTRDRCESPPFRLLARLPKVALATVATIALATAPPARAQGVNEADNRTLLGSAAFGDWKSDSPGVVRHLTPADLPPPYATRSAHSAGAPIARPNGVRLKVPPGFQAELYASGLKGARLLRTAPNGDVFLTQSEEGTISILQPGKEGGRATVSTFLSGLNQPFGLAFYPLGPDPKYLYIGTFDAVLRVPYSNGQSDARDEPKTIVARPPAGVWHWTRDLVFSPNGKTLYVSVGSASNDAEGGMEREADRANILAFNPDGSGKRRVATGIRNPVGLAIHPITGDLWTAVNERDGLGDNLPPDYVTRVVEGGFYGWPWFYIGDHEDPLHKGARAELRNQITVPDVLIQPHSVPLQITFYTGAQFPQAYRNDLFVALRGSANRSQRTGYKLVRVLLHDGKPTGEYQDFATGFVTEKGEVWGRPVGVTIAQDGALLLSDDTGGTIWRIFYKGAS